MTTVQRPTTWTATPALPDEGRSRAAEISVIVFFLVLFANVAVVLTQVHGVPEVVSSGFALLLLVPLARFLIVERRPVVVTPTLPLVFAFLAALFLSATLTSEPDVARQSIGLYITEGLILYLLLSNAVRTTRMLTLVSWTLIAAGSFMGGLSVYQELTGTYANDYAGFAQVDKLEEIASEEVERPRSGGPLGSENRYAQILAALLPLAVLRFFREPSRRLRLAAGAGALLILGGIVLTFSRGAAVAVAATLVLMVILREIGIRRSLVSLAALAAVVAVAFPDYVVRLSSLEGVTTLSEGSSGSADFGIVGLGTFLAMVATAMVILYRRARYWRPRDPERATLASSFLFALFAYLASSAFLHLSYQRFFWAFLALAASAAWALRPEEHEVPDRTLAGSRAR